MTNNGLIFKQVFFVLIPNEASALCKIITSISMNVWC